MIFSMLAFDVSEENMKMLTDVMAMDSITDQIHEAAHLRYKI